MEMGELWTEAAWVEVFASGRGVVSRAPGIRNRAKRSERTSALVDAPFVGTLEIALPCSFSGLGLGFGLIFCPAAPSFPTSCPFTLSLIHI